MAGDTPDGGRAASVVRYVLNVAFILVFVWLAVNNIILRRQLNDMQQEVIRARRALSSTAFAAGDRLDSMRLVDLTGAERLFDLKRVAQPTLFAVVDPSCSSCGELARDAARLARENPRMLVKVIALGDRDGAATFSRRIEMRGNVFQLPVDTPAVLRQKLMAAPQAFVVAPRGIVIATCERIAQCVAGASIY